ncbi:MAG: hypothetical protein QM756_04750 [Polyangiaceae bacterium]
MNDSELEEAALLRQARAGLSPSAADGDRVRRALELSLTLGSGAVAHGATTQLSGLAKLGLAAAVAAGTGLGGYWLGYHAGAADRATAATQARAPAPAAPAVLEAPAPARSSEPEVATPPVVSPRAGTSASRVPTAAASTSQGAPRDTKETASEPTLEAETRLLARVERALRDQNPRFALALLGELDREVPGGQLREEREAARVVAHCELESPTAAELSQNFIARHKGSALAARIVRACNDQPEHE